MNLENIFDNFYFLASFIFFIFFAFLLRFIIKKYITSKIELNIAKKIIRNFSIAIVFWGALYGLWYGINFLDLSDSLIQEIEQFTYISIAFSIVLLLAYFLSDLLKAWSMKVGPQAVPITGLGQFGIKLIVSVIGLLIILASLGIQITPVLASVGIAGLAIALALQPTLANLFAGIYIIADKPVRVGDFIKLESGEEGFITDIGWRSTRLRMLPNNTVIIPNQRLADSIVLNYYYPEQKLALLMEIGVSYEDDPKKVEKILVEEMTKASFEVDGMVTAYESKPFVRFIPGYKDFSLNFTTICLVREVIDRFYVQHELRKRIFDRFKYEGITIPFPIRSLHFSNKYMKDLKQFDLFKEKAI